LLLVVVLGLAVSPGRAEEPSSPIIVDEAKLFSERTLAEASAQGATIREKYGVDLVIETLKEPPKIKAEKHALLRAFERRRQLTRWAQHRADWLGADRVAPLMTGAATMAAQSAAGRAAAPSWAVVTGVVAALPADDVHPLVYIVIFPNSRKFDARVATWPEKGVRQLSRSVLDNMSGQLTIDLREGHDTALLREIVRLRAALAPDGPLGAWAALAVVGALIGAGIVLGIVRSRLARRVEDGPPTPLFQPATMGVLFGVPAAFWVHDQLFRLIQADSEKLPRDLPLQTPLDLPAPGQPGNEPLSP